MQIFLSGYIKEQVPLNKGKGSVVVSHGDWLPDSVNWEI